VWHKLKVIMASGHWRVFEAKQANTFRRSVERWVFEQDIRRRLESVHCWRPIRKDLVGNWSRGRSCEIAAEIAARLGADFLVLG